MHDIDRTLTESEESMGETEQEGAILPESLEMELAGELLSVGSEAEMEQFLGDLVKTVGGAIGSFVKTPAGKAITGALKSVARQALPQVGSAIGGYLGGSSGAKLGGQLASQAGKVFGLELEGLSAEDREYEIARQFVRFASQAAKTFLKSHPTANQMAAAREAILKAAHKHAPGILPLLQDRPNGHKVVAKSGRWVRRGDQIILIGL